MTVSGCAVPPWRGMVGCVDVSFLQGRAVTKGTHKQFPSDFSMAEAIAVFEHSLLCLIWHCLCSKSSTRGAVKGRIGYLISIFYIYKGRFNNFAEGVMEIVECTRLATAA